MIDKNTQLCISISARPSNFGTTVHNAAYQAARLNFIYKAFAVTDVRAAVAAVQALGIRGCSVSMPFKERAAKLVDALDPAAREIGAINTIVNDGGQLTGYNTDMFGALKALQSIKVRKNDRVLIAGAGGVARAIVCALRTCGVHEITVTSRTVARSRTFARALEVSHCAWYERNTADADVRINATPIGMKPDDAQTPFDANVLKACRAVMDVVIDPMETRLIREARKAGAMVAPGYKMALYQAIRQFELYTGKRPPVRVMESAMTSLLKP